MSADAERKSATWVVEVAFAVLLTVELLPVLLLYALDLAAGTVAPDAEKALVAAVGIVGLVARATELRRAGAPPTGAALGGGDGRRARGGRGDLPRVGQRARRG
jgi:hypothetical protein